MASRTVPAEALRPERLLGATVRRMRLGRSMTLVRLADAAGLSHSFLSQLERGLARPSMASLDRIAVALGTSSVELLAGQGTRSPQGDSHVVLADHAVEGSYGLGTARLLGSDLLTFVPMECRGANTEAGAVHAHAEDEFLTVVEGDLVLDLGDDRQVLHPGDSAIIASGTPHRWRSPDGLPYRLFVVKEAQGIARLRDDLGRATAVPEEWT